MGSPLDMLGQMVAEAAGRAFGAQFSDIDPVLRMSQFADAQANCALGLAKDLRRSPRQIADDLAVALRSQGLNPVAAVEVSGPGYLNFTFADEWVAQQVANLASDPRLGVRAVQADTIPIDYSAPNVAKEMHVGHLRTTIIGDCLARVLGHLGHRVVRQNHIGDWGTPFGMLIEHLLDVGADSDEATWLRSDPNAFYQAARRKFDSDDVFAGRARGRVVMLQAHDADTLATWQELLEQSKAYFNNVYERLDVTLTDADLAGESSYNDDLAAICDELTAAGIATFSAGALCVFLPGYTGRDGQPSPLIIRKSDGGYGYATTDLATIRYRVSVLRADRLLYVIGTPQSLHLQMVWETARLAGWLPESVPTVHIQVGNVLGADHKILRSRSGETVRLLTLLDSAAVAARSALDDRDDLTDADRETIGRAVSIAAVKYADLSVGHDTDYVFDIERMIAPTGNTGPYIQYAATRIKSIFRGLGLDPLTYDPGAMLKITTPGERQLALALLDYGRVIEEVGATYQPHKLCAYLFRVAQDYSRFYETSPIAQADPLTRASRLLLAQTTLAILNQGTNLLGITVPERM